MELTKAKFFRKKRELANYHNLDVLFDLYKNLLNLLFEKIIFVPELQTTPLFVKSISAKILEIYMKANFKFINN